MTALDAYRGAYDRSTEQDRIQGRLWYPAAQAICKEIAHEHGYTWQAVARALAALSPQTRWEENIKLAWDLAAGNPRGTFQKNLNKGLDCLLGAKDVLSGRKVRSFAAAILGNRNAACIDTWMLRSAGHKVAFTKGRVEDCQRALAQLATETGESIRDLQAIVWIVVRREGS